MIDLVYLRTFLTIYRIGSLVHAGKVLHLSQPAMSGHLKALEAEVGQPLFRRHARGLSPTPAGDDLAARVATPLDALVDVGEQLRASLRAPTGTVHLGGPIDLLSLKVVPALARLQGQHPQLRFVVRPGLTSELITHLRAGDLDLVVTEQTSAAEFDYDPLFTETQVLVVSRARAKELSALPDEVARIRALRGGPFVSFAPDMPVIRQFMSRALGEPFTGSPSLVVPDLRAVANAVTAGAFATVIARHVVAPMLDSGEVVAVAAEEHGKRLQLASRPGVRGTPRISLVRKALLADAANW